MIRRPRYYSVLKPFIGKPIVKAITGVRRCGKSTMLQLVKEDLLEQGIDPEKIIIINKELLEFDTIRTYRDLNKFVKSRFKPSRKKQYLFIDEIQEIVGWEKAVASFLAENLADIYITGSNARLMSSELATLLSGRYIEIPMHTLTYSEFNDFSKKYKKIHSRENSFDIFLKYGGFPGLHMLDWSDEVVRQYLQALYSTILLKDVVVRYGIRDAFMLERIAEYLTANCGNITSANRISEFVKSQKLKLSVETVQNYITYISNAALVYQVRRFDLKGRRILEMLEKYYLCDIGFRFSSIGFTPENLPGQLENTVFLELISRGYEVFIGKMNEFEVDFIARKGNEKIYLQVCVSLVKGKTIDREYRALEVIADHFPKMVLSLDEDFETSRKGIKWMNIQNFLLSDW